jgi:hypothetical protein
MQPTGMSVERCIAALNTLNDELKQNSAYMGANGHPQQRMSPSPGNSTLEIARDLTLDIDLRHDAMSSALMSEIESSLYLPLIENVLALLKQISTGDANAMDEARQLIQVALKSAIAVKRAPY